MSGKRYTKTITLPDGSRKWIRAATPEELEKKVFELQLQLHQGIDLSRHDTFGELAQLWYDTYKKPYLRPNTLNALKTTLNKHIMPVLAPIPVREITPFQIQQVFAAMSNLSKGYNNTARIILNQIFDMAVDNNLITKSPVPNSLQHGGKPVKEKQALTAAQQQQLLDSVTGQTRLFCALGLACGLRRGEIIGLHWSDLDLDSGIIHVRHNWTTPANYPPQITENMKTSTSRRDLPIPPQLLQTLRAARASACSLLVFPGPAGGPLTASQFQSLWKPAQKTGLPVTPHILRHTCATNLLEAGMDIKEIQYYLGHSDLNTTLSVYTHYQQSTRLQQTAARAASAFAVNL